MEKTFADGGKIAKFVKVFSLESFPLYGMVQIIIDLRYARYRQMTEMNCVRCSMVVIVIK